MQRIPYGKLVRDRIPDILESQGITHSVHLLEEVQYAQALVDKLREEVDEFCLDRQPEELADILEVILALAKNQGIGADELESIREAKRKERGGFEDRVFLEWAQG